MPSLHRVVPPNAKSSEAKQSPRRPAVLTLCPTSPEACVPDRRCCRDYEADWICVKDSCVERLFCTLIVISSAGASAVPPERPGASWCAPTARAPCLGQLHGGRAASNLVMYDLPRPRPRRSGARRAWTSWYRRASAFEGESVSATDLGPYGLAWTGSPRRATWAATSSVQRRELHQRFTMGVDALGLPLTLPSTAARAAAAGHCLAW